MTVWRSWSSCASACACINKSMTVVLRSAPVVLSLEVQNLIRFVYSSIAFTGKLLVARKEG